jgi:hypothetical protein
MRVDSKSTNHAFFVLPCTLLGYFAGHLLHLKSMRDVGVEIQVGAVEKVWFGL